MPRFPLEQISQNQLHQLCQTLWSWTLCDACHNLRRCSDEDCPGQRLLRLAHFFEYYKSLTRSYEPEANIGEPDVLNSHENLFALVQYLKTDSDLTRAQLAEIAYPTVSDQRTSSIAEQERAITLAV